LNPCLPALNLIFSFFPTTYKTQKTLGVRKIQKADTKRSRFLSSRKLSWPEHQFLPHLAPDLKSGLHQGDPYEDSEETGANHQENS
jgi:hypothetical protein